MSNLSFVGSGASAVVSHIRESSSAITNEQIWPDYASFINYVLSHDMLLISHADITLNEKLGTGASMAVYRAFIASHFGDTPLAVKRIDIPSPQWDSELIIYAEELRGRLELVSLEVRVLSNGLLRHHPNIARLLGISWEQLQVQATEDEEDEEDVQHSTRTQPTISPILVMEQASCTLMDLFEDIKKQRRPSLSMDEKISLWCDIADALSTVHLLGVIHGDVKPENILIFNDRSTGRLVGKLSDFGGCQPITETGGRVIDYGLGGTEYWNAPEGYDRNDPDFAKILRDYYSFGMVGAYILFEQKLFRPEEGRTPEQMRAAKKKYKWIAERLEAELAGIRSFIRSKGAQDILVALRLRTDALDDFKLKIRTFRALLEQGEIRHAITTSSYPLTFQAVENPDCRPFTMCFAVTRFLHPEPEQRRKYGLLCDLRTFIEDNKMGQNLGVVWGAKCWQDFLGMADEGVDLWGISSLDGEGVDNVRPRINQLARIPVENQSIDFLLGPAEYEALPQPLRKELMEQLQIKAGETDGEEKAGYLVSLAALTGMNSGESGRDFMDLLLQAARLGSTSAKWAFNMCSLDHLEKEHQPSGMEMNKWLLDIVFNQMPSAQAFIDRLQTAIPDLLVKWEFGDLRRELKVFNEQEERMNTDLLGDSPFETAIRSIVNGNANHLRQAIKLDKEAVLADRTDEGHALIHIAARFGQHELALLLVREYNVDIDILTDDGMTALVIATVCSKSETASALVNNGADSRYLLSSRVLRLVANDGTSQILRTIRDTFEAWVEHKSKIKQQSLEQEDRSVSLQAFLNGDFSFFTDTRPDSELDFQPIFASILGDNTGCLQTLLNLGCSQTVQTPCQSTSTTGARTVITSLAPIHVAASQLRPWHLAILLQHGVDPELPTDDEYRQTALHLACVAYRRGLYKFPCVPNYASKLKLLNTEVDLSTMNSTRLLMIQILVKCYGANVNTRDAQGRTALFFCMTMPNCLPIMKYLVEELDAKIGIKDYNGKSCLHYAAEMGSEIAYLKFCISARCKVHETDNYGRTPLSYAELRNRKEFCDLLGKHGGAT